MNTRFDRNIESNGFTLTSAPPIHSWSIGCMPTAARGGDIAPTGARRTPVGEHLGKSKQVSAMYLNALAVSLGE